MIGTKNAAPLISADDMHEVNRSQLKVWFMQAVLHVSNGVFIDAIRGLTCSS